MAIAKSKEKLIAIPLNLRVIIIRKKNKGKKQRNYKIKKIYKKKQRRLRAITSNREKSTIAILEKFQIWRHQ